MHGRMVPGTSRGSQLSNKWGQAFAIVPIKEAHVRIALIATYTHPVALGLRYVSSYLKAAGHDVKMIFMSSKRDTARADFSQTLLDDLIEHLRDRELIGMALMTNTFNRACVLTETVRRAGLKAPIIWGGTHPTVAPVESLPIADVICVGEGEEPTLQLVERMEAGRDPTNIGSLGFRADGPFGNRRDIRNEVRPLEQELDDYPFPDYELETHWVAGKTALEPARPENLRGTLHRLRIETTRGCPYPCTFCNNAALLKTYRGKGAWVRKRGADNVIEEINRARACFPTIEAVNVVDDLFFVRSEEDIDDFAVKYKERVNLPIELDAFPNTISEQKVKSLMRVPINLISMGIQSGSEHTLKHIYKRPTPIEKIVEGINIFSRNRIRAEYHYIVHNPFETDANRIETLRFAATHHRGPAILRVFPLQFYPRTPLYDQAREAGIIGDRHETAYSYAYTGKTQIMGTAYLDVWLRVVLNLRNIGIPSWPVHRLVDFAIHPWVRKVLDRTWFVPVSYGMYRVGRTIWKNFIFQPFIRPFKYLKRKPRYEELHPEDEVTLPRNNMREERPERDDVAAGQSTARPIAERGSEPRGRWTVPTVNRHALRARGIACHDHDHEQPVGAASGGLALTVLRAAH